MTPEQIEKFFSQNNTNDTPVRISFRSRNTVTGIFVQTPDAAELKVKNFWRIVSEVNLERWKKSNDFSLCRMFHGSEFTKLTVV
jgi:hypothetical protein